MSPVLRSTLIACLLPILVACDDGKKPSDLAKAIPGAKGTIELKPADWTNKESWWKDSDGVDPGVAGCHIGVTDKTGTVENGRKFGEACRPGEILVESNPDKGVVHDHKNDIGHPDTFDCPTWCQATKKESGVCAPSPAPPSCASSAVCACYEKPSDPAKAMPGAKGTIEFKPNDWTGQTSLWKDSDGVDPGTAGCHIGVTDNTGTVQNGRNFGEACLASGLLVESNPGKNEVHPHTNDVGHPDIFDCQAWCKAKEKETGKCEIAQAPPCASSAMCVCK